MLTHSGDFILKQILIITNIFNPFVKKSIQQFQQTIYSNAQVPLVIISCPNLIITQGWLELFPFKSIAYLSQKNLISFISAQSSKTITTSSNLITPIWHLLGVFILYVYFQIPCKNVSVLEFQ